MAKIYLPKYIAEHYKGGVTAQDVVREALTNAIQAGGTDVSVDLVFANRQTSFLDDDRNYLESITVTDNGEGFTKKNLEYFDEVCTPHKDDIGGKGVGRLSYLKYGDLVTVSSQITDQLIKFSYTPYFTLDDVIVLPKSGPVKTSVQISQPKDQVYSQVAKLINGICDDLQLFLFLKKKSSRRIAIKFRHNSTQPFPSEFIFDNEAIEPVAESKLIVGGFEFDCYLFRDENRKGISAMLCANEVCVEELAVSKRFDVCRYTLSVTSSYLDGKANSERKRIELPQSQDDPDFLSPVTREVLTKAVRDKAIEMINLIGGGSVDKFRQQNIAKLQKYYPFISLETFGGGASFLDADDIVRDYRATQARREDAIVEDLAKGRGVSWDDVSHLASDDLARYIVHRALLINSLSKLPAGTAEEAIHQAILPKGSDGSGIRTNNIWIVDDKFLAYSSIYSDEALRIIIHRVNAKTESKLGKKPDIAVFFTNDSDDKPNKLVIVEFKKPGVDVFDSNKALTQCRVYASDLCEAIESVREVFSFAVVDVNDEFYRDLRQQGFKPVFSLTERVMYNDYSVGLEDDIPLHLYVTPAAALLADAKARNRIFEEVLQFKAVDG